MRNRRPTMGDVARAAGVSTATVSRVMNGERWVSKETEATVLAAVEEVGYVMNNSARSLRTGTSSTVAFLLTVPEVSLFGDPTFSVLLREISVSLAEYDYAMVLLIAGTPEETRRAMRVIEGRLLDGVILVSLWANDPLVKQLLRHDIPVVYCGFAEKFSGRVSSVRVDDASGGRLAARHLLERGRTRLVCLAGPDNTPAGTLRLAGFGEAAGDALLPDGMERGDFSPMSGEYAMSLLLERHPDLDGVFAASDSMALGALAALAAKGRRVPEDVAIVGFDDNHIAITATPSLTTVRQSFDLLGHELVRLLDEEMSRGVRASLVLPVELIVRDST